MNHLFSHEINGWADWGRLYQNIEAWRELIGFILKKEGLPPREIGRLTPGTNAVFRVGGSVIKIFAPKESGLDAFSDYSTELFGLRHANALGVAAPRLQAAGWVDDKYRFYYLAMEFVDGVELKRADKRLSLEKKEQIGREIASIIRRMNVPVESFNGVNAVERAKKEQRWRPFCPAFLHERQQWLENCAPPATVFVHGDINPDNLLITPSGGMALIDFADSLIAPPEYELPPIICDLFAFQKPYLKGFLGEHHDPQSLVEPVFRGLLLHDFGADIIKCSIAPVSEVTSLSALKEIISNRLK